MFRPYLILENRNYITETYGPMTDIVFEMVKIFAFKLSVSFELQFFAYYLLRSTEIYDLAIFHSSRIFHSLKRFQYISI